MAVSADVVVEPVAPFLDHGLGVLEVAELGVTEDLPFKA